MADVIAQILAKAERSIQGAEVLFQRGLYDFSVSRAYYAMFYGAEVLLLKKGLSFSKHSAVISAFGKHFAKPRLIDPVFHQYLAEGFDERQLADYAFEEEIAREDAQLQIDRAKAFLQTARDWLRETPR